MAVVGVAGASGIVGRDVVVGLCRASHDVVAIGRDVGRLSGAGFPDAVRQRVDDGSVPAATVVGDLDVLVVTAGSRGAGDDPRRRAIVGAIEAGTAVVDVDPEQAAILDVVGLAHDATAPVVLGAGLQPAMGELLGALALGVVELPVELHTAYTFPDAGSPPLHRRASAGRRGSAAQVLGVRGSARLRGEDVEELAGEMRRLAWFPRPVGPSHAAAIPSGESVLVPRWAPDIQTVRSSVAIPSWRAELLQASANLAGWGPGRRWLGTRLLRQRPQPGQARRAALRWGCVAEVSGGDELSRAWAYGHDPYGLTARIAVRVVQAVVGADVPAGVTSPARLADPAQLLDDLGRDTDTRWSLVRP